MREYNSISNICNSYVKERSTVPLEKIKSKKWNRMKRKSNM